jgi:hypothetical protein
MRVAACFGGHRGVIATQDQRLTVDSLLRRKQFDF